MTQGITLRQDRKLISANSAISPACAKTISPSRSAKSNSAQMKIPNRLLFMPQASLRVKARMKYTVSKTQTGMNIADALSCFASDIKVGVSWLLRQMDKLSTLKKMTPRTGETEGSGFSLLGEVLNRAGVIAPGVPDKVMFISRFVNPLRSHVPLSLLVHSRTRRSGAFAPGGQVRVIPACQKHAYECQDIGFVHHPAQQPLSTGRAIGSRYEQHADTVNIAPQTVLPSAGRDNGARAMSLKDHS